MTRRLLALAALFAIAAPTAPAARADYRSTILGDSPAQYLRLDETSGTTAADSSTGGTYTGTYMPTVSLNQAGLISDGSGDRAVTIGSGGYVSLTIPQIRTGPFTREGWFKLSAAPSNSPVVIWSAGTYWLGINTSGQITLNVGGSSVTSSASVADGDPHYFAVVRVTSGTPTIHLYLDGDNEVGTGIADSSDLTGTTAQLGALGGSFNFLGGTLDESALYLTGLTGPQLDAHYEAGAGGAPSLAAGTASTVSTGSTIATVTVGAATGGTSPYSYQWYRSTTSGFTPGSGNRVAGATSQTLNDTGLSNGTTYYYVNVVTDSATPTPATANSNQTSATPAAGPQTIPVTSSGIYWSPGGWDSSGNGTGTYQANRVYSGSSWARTNSAGNYLKFSVVAGGGDSISLLLDTSSLSGITAANCPTLTWTINGSALGTFSYDGTNLTPSGNAALLPYQSSTYTLPLSSGLASGTTYQGTVYFRGIAFTGAGAGDRWTTPANAVKVVGLLIGASASMGTPTAYPNEAICYADSGGEGADAASAWEGGGNSPGDMDASLSFVRSIAEAFQCEVGLAAYSGQGYTTGGIGGVPGLPSAYGLHSSGRSRLAAGVLPFSPAYLFDFHGTNDGSGLPGSAVQSMLGIYRTIAPSAKVIKFVPWGQTSPLGAVASASGIHSGFASYQAATPDALCYLADPGHNYLGQVAVDYSNSNENDPVHLNARGIARYATASIQKAQAAMGGTSGGGRRPVDGGPVSLRLPGCERWAIDDVRRRKAA